MKIFLKRFLIYLIQKFSLNERLASLNKLVNYKVNKPYKDKVFELNILETFLEIFS